MQLYYIIFILIKMSNSELVPNKCAPGRSNINGTCLKKEEITEIAKNNNVDSSKENILDEVKKTTGCDTDKCLVNHLNKNGEIDLDVTRPTKPKSWEKNSKEWLSSIDIDRVYHNTKKNIQILFFMDHHLLIMILKNVIIYLMKNVKIFHVCYLNCVK